MLKKTKYGEFIICINKKGEILYSHCDEFDSHASLCYVHNKNEDDYCKLIYDNRYEDTCCELGIPGLRYSASNDYGRKVPFVINMHHALLIEKCISSIISLI